MKSALMSTKQFAVDHYSGKFDSFDAMKYSPAHLRCGMHSYSPGSPAFEAIESSFNETQRVLLDPPLVDGKLRVHKASRIADST